jgi:hypothetical protein
MRMIKFSLLMEEISHQTVKAYVIRLTGNNLQRD